MISLGIYPVVTLIEARAKRDKSRKQVANAINPNEARKAEKAATINQTENTFKNIALEWYEGRKDRWSVGYRDDMMDAFEKRCISLYRSLPDCRNQPHGIT